MVSRATILSTFQKTLSEVISCRALHRVRVEYEVAEEVIPMVSSYI